MKEKEIKTKDIFVELSINDEEKKIIFNNNKYLLELYINGEIDLNQFGFSNYNKIANILYYKMENIIKEINYNNKCFTDKMLKDINDKCFVDKMLKNIDDKCFVDKMLKNIDDKYNKKIIKITYLYIFCVFIILLINIIW